MELVKFDQYSCMNGLCRNEFWVKVDVDPDRCPYCGDAIEFDFEAKVATDEISA